MGSAEALIEALISATLIVAGLITYYVAPRRGRGTLGFRVGPAYVSEEVWARINREAGAALTIAGAILLGASMLNPPLHGFVAITAGILVAEVVGLTARAKQLAERASVEAPGEEGAPTPITSWVGWGRALLASVPPAIALLSTAAYAHALPESIPVHFSIGGEPDSFMSRWVFEHLMIPASVTLSSLGLIYALSTKHPLIGYRPWGRRGESARVISDVVTLVSYAVALGYVDTLHYAVAGAHLVPPAVLVVFPVAAVARALLWAKRSGAI